MHWWKWSWRALIAIPIYTTWKMCNFTDRCKKNPTAYYATLTHSHTAGRQVHMQLALQSALLKVPWSSISIPHTSAQYSAHTHSALTVANSVCDSWSICLKHTRLDAHAGAHMRAHVCRDVRVCEYGHVVIVRCVQYAQERAYDIDRENWRFQNFENSKREYSVSWWNILFYGLNELQFVMWWCVLKISFTKDQARW